MAFLDIATGTVVVDRPREKAFIESNGVLEYSSGNNSGRKPE